MHLYFHSGGRSTGYVGESICGAGYRSLEDQSARVRGDDFGAGAPYPAGGETRRRTRQCPIRQDRKRQRPDTRRLMRGVAAMRKALAGLLSSAVAALAATCAAAQQPVKVGVILAYSGQFADP